MAPTALIDTNILVYAYDRRDLAKQQRARQVLVRLKETSVGYLSVKTLSEFFVIVGYKRGFPDRLTPDEALGEIQRYVVSWPVLDLTPEIVVEAARGVRDHGLSYWDAQMWATAKLHNLDALFSEDLSDGSVIEGVTIMNPLLPSFDLEAWLNG